MAASRQQYAVHFRAEEGNATSCDWRWPEGYPVWKMSSQEGNGWYVNGPLNERGRAEILKHFGLEAVSDELPLEVIAEMSPFALLAIRRMLEAANPALPRLDPVSDRIGGHVAAECAA